MYNNKNKWHSTWANVGQWTRYSRQALAGLNQDMHQQSKLVLIYYTTNNFFLFKHFSFFKFITNQFQLMDSSISLRIKYFKLYAYFLASYTFFFSACQNFLSNSFLTLKIWFTTWSLSGGKLGEFYFQKAVLDFRYQKAKFHSLCYICSGRRKQEIIGWLKIKVIDNFYASGHSDIVY